MIDTFRDIEKLEADLWEAAHNLRAKYYRDGYGRKGSFGLKVFP